MHYVFIYIIFEEIGACVAIPLRLDEAREQVAVRFPQTLGGGLPRAPSTPR